MQRDSVHSANVTLGPMTLGLLRLLGHLSREHDPHGATATNMLRGLHEVQIRSFQFATGHTYTKADLEVLTSRLPAAGWRRVVQVRDRGTDEYVNIWCSLGSHTIRRLVIIDAEPREFTWVSIVGTMDPRRIGMLREDFIPRDQSR
jgi:hypothetical protein